MNRISPIFWYYFVLVLLLAAAFFLGDFSEPSFLRRFIIVLAAAAIFNPFIFLWRREWRRGREKISAQSFSESERRTLVAELESLRRQVGENARLRAQALQAKDLELRLANQRLLELERAKAEFVSVTSHQLRTPLSGIKWALNMLLRGQLGAVNSEQKNFLTRSADGVERMVSLINNLLKLDVLEVDKKEYQFSRLNLVDLLRRLIADFNERLQSKQLTVEFSPPPVLPEVEVDPLRLRMVLENIVDNAVRYTPPQGKITLAVSSERLNSARPVLEVIIKDTGIGIPASEQEKIFKRFYRSSNAVKSSPDGTGLGLSIAKTIVEKHGGEIWFQSREGEGTAFHFTIPLRQTKIETS